MYMIYFEGSLEVKLPTIWTDGKAEVARVRGEEQKREDQRRERVRRKKMQVREKVGKSRNTVFFQWFVAPEGRKVGSLKRRVRSHVVIWEMKNCALLWREAHFQVKMHKTHQHRTTFGSWDVEKVHAVVARSTLGSQNVQNSTKHFSFGALLDWDVEKVQAVVAQSTFQSQNVQNTPAPDHFWKLRCRKSARRCGAKHIPKSKGQKTEAHGALLDVQMSFCVAGARDCAPSQKWAKREGFVAFKNDGRRGTFQEDLERCIWRGRRSTRHTDQGRDFLREVAFWSMRSSGLWQNRKTHWHEADSSALNFPFLKEVSQNCFVFDVVKFKNWRSLAEPFRFWCCQVQELRKSRRIVSFLTLSSSKLRSSRRIAAFSILQVDRQIDRQLQLPLPLQTQGKQDAAHEPECSHVKHFCETSDLNSVVHFSPVTVPVHCRLWDPEEGRVQSAAREDNGVLKGGM